MSDRPRFRQIDSWRAAEDNAAAWMRFWGYSDADVTPAGPDAGIDVRARAALAQVKWEAAQTGTPALQRLVGARRTDHHMALLFFSGAGYSAPAVEYADDVDIALFKYALDGAMTPVNAPARRLVAKRQTQDSAATTVGASRGRRQVSSMAAPSPSAQWWGRNGSLLLGLFFLLQAIVNGVGVLQGEPRPGIDWYDPLISLLLGIALLGLWRGLGERRRRSGPRQVGDPNASLPKLFTEKS
jgi:hypothetical protein